jgi:hypothetical protein
MAGVAFKTALSRATLRSRNIAATETRPPGRSKFSADESTKATFISTLDDSLF